MPLTPLNSTEERIAYLNTRYDFLVEYCTLSREVRNERRFLDDDLPTHGVALDEFNVVVKELTELGAL
jgi:hypothetical protein